MKKFNREKNGNIGRIYFGKYSLPMPPAIVIPNVPL